ncbi:hypothetical protein E1B28_010239 [Marasmius oreades]|uniref:BTB domain-containing protein n=1 Tax=Marasmius oreades TaxID=181124 RepID=A0A9P7URA2_9AGAR|nr:uncharacterized protein E1B28_010239 [Marasmius oreades]KAG7091188.1 hypothetical protein E1B28_010239 [Marasmius oreades]
MSDSNSNGQANGDLKRTGKSEKYFLNGADVFFLVGGSYFRVHSYFFLRESHKFEQFLSSNLHKGGGNDIHSAIQLNQVTAQEFERFLWVFYNPIHGVYDAPVEDWESILKLAHLWSFPEVKALAIRELQKLDMPDVDRITMYQDYAVEAELISPIILRLCQRDYNLDYAEAEKLGMSTAVLVYQGRELLRSAPGSGGRSPLPTGIDEQEAQQMINVLLKRSPAVARQANGANWSDTSRPGSPGIL